MNTNVSLQPFDSADPWLAPRTPTFSSADRAVLARQWLPVARAEDVPGDRPLPVTLLDLELVVYRTSQGVRAARDLCPHRGVPLRMGSVEGDHLVCGYHGLRYAPDGRCVAMPAHPGLAAPARMCLRGFAAQERYGLVWVRLDARGDAGLPDFSAWDDPGFQQVSPPPVDIAGSAGRQVEGFVDVAHFAWIHDQSFADRNLPEVPPYEVERTATGLRFEFVSPVSNYPKALQHLEPPGFLWRRVFDIYPPFCATLAVHFPTGVHYILNAASPVTARRTRLFTPVARNFTDIGTAEQAAEFKIRIVLEDKAVVENQYPAELPLDGAIDTAIPADKMSVQYRRLLREMGLTLRPGFHAVIRKPPNLRMV